LAVGLPLYLFSQWSGKGKGSQGPAA